MRALLGVAYETNEDNKKDYKLPDLLAADEEARTDGDRNKLHNPEWLVDCNRSDVNQAFIRDAVKRSIDNLLVSVFIFCDSRCSPPVFAGRSRGPS